VWYLRMCTLRLPLCLARYSQWGQRWTGSFPPHSNTSWRFNVLFHRYLLPQCWQLNGFAWVVRTYLEFCSKFFHHKEPNEITIINIHNFLANKIDYTLSQSRIHRFRASRLTTAEAHCLISPHYVAKSTARCAVLNENWYSTLRRSIVSNDKVIINTLILHVWGYVHTSILSKFHT